MRAVSVIVIIVICFSKIDCASKRCIDGSTAVSTVQKSTIDFIAAHNYPYEIHHVTTEDGYVLELHRIPSSPKSARSYGSKLGKNRRKLGKKANLKQQSKFHQSDEGTLRREKRHFFKKKKRSEGVVFLMHGILSSSADWVVSGPGKGLAFILADEHWDVWMGNARGNKYSRKHIALDPDTDRDFWNFSWNEIGAIDLPACIDYIIEVTGEEKVTYVGHSQGTTSFFVMATERPEYNDKINSMHALAPVAYMRHITNPYALAGLPLAKTLEVLGQTQGFAEYFSANDYLTKISSMVCSDDNAIRGICVKIYLAAFGFDPENVNRTLIPEIMQNIPAGASSKQFIHYMQVIKSGNFRQYDHGLFENLMIYNSILPPDYDFTKITCPVALYYGDKDNLATPKDVHHLSKILPNLTEIYRVDHKKFTHVDFLWAVNIRKLVYDRVIQNIMKYL